MEITKVYNYLLEKAPLELSDSLCKLENMHDNSGLLLECQNFINGILFALDLTAEVVKKAEGNGYNLIVTHHPVIYYPISKLTNNENNLVLECVKNKISVISMHLNLDSSKDGIDQSFAKGLGAKEIEIITKINDESGYGSIFNVEETTLKSFVDNIKTVFNTDKIFVFGDENKKINKVCSLCGGGTDENTLNKARGCDVLVSSDIPHHRILSLLENNIAVVQMTHYATEYYGLKKLYEQTKKDFKNEKIDFFTDKRFL